jgi:hypothetical protein
MRYSPSIKSFFPEEWSYPEMPDDIVTVSDEQHASVINRAPGATFEYVNGQFVISAPSPMSLGDLKAVKLAGIAREFSERMSTLKSSYPEEEIQSWFKQESEARAHINDANADTPLLSAMAAARGITVEDLALRVVTNADAWSTVSGELIGKRQKYEDQIAAANDAVSVSAVVWID